MERSAVWERASEICRDVFNNRDLTITEGTTAADIAEWDSLTHLSLIDELERQFHVTFTLDEVSESKDLGELMEALMKHIKEK